MTKRLVLITATILVYFVSFAQDFNFRKSSRYGLNLTPLVNKELSVFYENFYKSSNMLQFTIGYRDDFFAANDMHMGKISQIWTYKNLIFRLGTKKIVKKSTLSSYFMKEILLKYHWYDNKTFYYGSDGMDGTPTETWSKKGIGLGVNFKWGVLSNWNHPIFTDFNIGFGAILWINRGLLIYTGSVQHFFETQQNSIKYAVYPIPTISLNWSFGYQTNK